MAVMNLFLSVNALKLCMSFFFVSHWCCSWVLSFMHIWRTRLQDEAGHIVFICSICCIYHCVLQVKRVVRLLYCLHHIVLAIFFLWMFCWPFSSEMVDFVCNFQSRTLSGFFHLSMAGSEGQYGLSRDSYACITLGTSSKPFPDDPKSFPGQATDTVTSFPPMHTQTVSLIRVQATSKTDDHATSACFSWFQGAEGLIFSCLFVWLNSSPHLLRPGPHISLMHKRFDPASREFAAF